MVNKHFCLLRDAGHSLQGCKTHAALGAKLDCPLPLISLDAQALASEVCKGRGEWDSSDIISFYEDLAFPLIVQFAKP